MKVVQGPRRTDPFFNRVTARRSMRKQLTARRGERRLCLMFVHAPEGLGRFSLASEFFHEDPGAFDGYCVEVTARQVDGEPVPLGEMLGQALRGLGLSDSDQPSSDAARAETYQRLSAGRRFLLVVKDAITADQVRPLIPALAPEAAVVVTTRTVLRELYELDFIDIPLGKLPDDDSHALLAFGLGATASKIDDATVRELAGLCDGYPLLIRIVAAHIVGRPRAARRFVAEVRRSGAALLDMDPVQRLVRFLDFTYEGLLTELQQTYRRAALIPGPDFSAAAAAIAFGTDPGHAERLLDDLVDANLLTFEEPDRYSFHSVIRTDAQRRAHKTDGDVECAAVTEGLVTWYLQEAVPRDAALADRWRVGPVFDAYAALGAQPPAREDAIAWFEAEWRGVVACVGAAHRAGLHQVAWQLCVAVFKFLHAHGHHDAWLESHRLGLESARALGDTAAIMQLSNQRGAAFLATGDLEAARADFDTSRDAALRAGHMLGLQSACEWLGKRAAAGGDTPTAFAFYNESEQVIDQAGKAIPARQQARMRALLHLQRGRAHLIDGDERSAAAAATSAVDYFDHHSSERENLAKCLVVLAAAARLAGTADEAAALLRRAVDLFAADNLRRPHAAALADLGDVLAPTDPSAARDVLQRANDLYMALGDPAADAVQARLSSLDPNPISSG